MGEHLAQVARLRVAVAAGSPIPRDLGAWLLDILGELEPAAERIDRRNGLLRAAAARVGGSAWAKAGRLEAEIAAVEASPGLRTRSADTDAAVRDLVARALQADPGAPRSRRQLFRLLRGD